VRSSGDTDLVVLTSFVSVDVVVSFRVLISSYDVVALVAVLSSPVICDDLFITVLQTEFLKKVTINCGL